MTDLNIHDHEGESSLIDGSLRQMIAAMLASMVVALLSWWGVALDRRVSQVEQTVGTHSERLSTEEARHAATQRQLDAAIEDFKEHARRIEAKLDRLIEAQTGARRFDR